MLSPARLALFERARGAVTFELRALMVNSSGTGIDLHPRVAPPGMTPRVAGDLLAALAPGNLLDRRFQLIDRDRFSEALGRTVPRRHRLHVAFLQTGEDNDRRPLPMRVDRHEECETLRSWIEIDHDMIDVIKFAVQKNKRFVAILAQAHAVPGAGAGFQDECGAIRVRVDEKYDFLFHLFHFPFR
jgi:hypothetical protein